tara:strand:- start:113 stop:1363 length:1251 start_codon:yes stop_codon:yes gene_type:complete
MNTSYQLDVDKIRRDFPTLKREVNSGASLVYLDNAATSLRPIQVMAQITRFYRDHNSNIHRGVHTLSVEATEMFENIRSKVGKFINAEDSREVIFTRGTTESINLVVNSWGRKFLKPNDEVIISELEHHSNIVPWQMLRDSIGIKLKYIPMLDNGHLDMDVAESMINSKTKIVSITAVSNALGTIIPIEKVISLAKKQGALVLVDCAQSVPHLKVDVQSLGADFIAFSAHKMLGPTGVGVLWGKFDILDSMDPFLGGGDMILTVNMDHSTWAEIPSKFEAGTPNIGGVIGFGAAIDYLNDIGMENIRAHEVDLTDYALQKMIDVPGITIFGPNLAKERGGVISFALENVHPHDIGQILDDNGVAVRAGHHCAQPVMNALGVPATVRASFYIYNTREDIDALVNGLSVTTDLFGVKS